MLDYCGLGVIRGENGFEGRRIGEIGNVKTKESLDDQNSCPHCLRRDFARRNSRIGLGGQQQLEFDESASRRIRKRGGYQRRRHDPRLQSVDHALQINLSQPSFAGSVFLAEPAFLQVICRCKAGTFPWLLHLHARTCPALARHGHRLMLGSGRANLWPADPADANSVEKNSF